MKKFFKPKIIEKNNCNPSDIDCNTFTDTGIDSVPSGQGNYQTTLRELEAQDAFNISTIPKEINNTKNSVDSQYPIYSVYYMMQFYSNYFCGRFNIITEDKLMQKAIADCILAGFFYGRSMLMQTQNGKTGQIKWVPYAINSIKTFPNGDIKMLKVFPASVAISAGKQIEDRDVTMIYIPKDKFRYCAIYQWNNQGLSCWARLLPFVTCMRTWIQKITLLGINFNNKLLYTMLDPSNSTAEIDAYIDSSKPIIIKTGIMSGGNETLQSNKFEYIGDKNNVEINNITQAYNLFKSEYYELLGIEFDKDPKAERKTVGEVEASAGFGKSSEYDYYMQVEVFKYQIEQLHGKTLDIANYSVSKKETE